MKKHTFVGCHIECLVETVDNNYIVTSCTVNGLTYRGVLINESASTVRRPPKLHIDRDEVVCVQPEDEEARDRLLRSKKTYGPHYGQSPDYGFSKGKKTTNSRHKVSTKPAGNEKCAKEKKAAKLAKTPSRQEECKIVVVQKGTTNGETPKSSRYMQNKPLASRSSRYDAGESSSFDDNDKLQVVTMSNGSYCASRTAHSARKDTIKSEPGCRKKEKPTTSTRLTTKTQIHDRKQTRRIPNTRKSISKVNTNKKIKASLNNGVRRKDGTGKGDKIKSLMIPKLDTTKVCMPAPQRTSRSQKNDNQVKLRSKKCYVRGSIQGEASPVKKYAEDKKPNAGSIRKKDTKRKKESTKERQLNKLDVDSSNLAILKSRLSTKKITRSCTDAVETCTDDDEEMETVPCDEVPTTTAINDVDISQPSVLSMHRNHSSKAPTKRVDLIALALSKIQQRKLERQTCRPEKDDIKPTDHRTSIRLEEDDEMLHPESVASNSSRRAVDTEALYSQFSNTKINMGKRKLDEGLQRYDDCAKVPRSSKLYSFRRQKVEAAAFRQKTGKSCPSTAVKNTCKSKADKKCVKYGTRDKCKTSTLNERKKEVSENATKKKNIRLGKLIMENPDTLISRGSNNGKYCGGTKGSKQNGKTQHCLGKIGSLMTNRLIKDKNGSRLAAKKKGVSCNDVILKKLGSNSVQKDRSANLSNKKKEVTTLRENINVSKIPKKHSKSNVPATSKTRLKKINKSSSVPLRKAIVMKNASKQIIKNGTARNWKT